MREIQQELINYIKSLPEVRGCITGSALLNEYYEGSDVDCFLYDTPSFLKMYYTLKLNPMFTILEPLEQWKATMIENKDFTSNKHKGGVTTLKFYYNTAIPINIIYKSNCNNIFSVLSSFDLDIICKGYCLQSKKYLDLTDGSSISKIANVNQWNPAMNSSEVWQISRILRQLERVFKYHKRNFNMDNVVNKYISLIDKIQEFESIFSSENFNEKLKISQDNTKIVKEICEIWLNSHEISEKELETLNIKIKEL